MGVSLPHLLSVSTGSTSGETEAWSQALPFVAGQGRCPLASLTGQGHDSVALGRWPELSQEALLASATTPAAPLPVPGPRLPCGHSHSLQRALWGPEQGRAKAGPFISWVAGWEQDDPRGHSRLPGTLAHAGVCPARKEEPQGRLRGQELSPRAWDFSPPPGLTPTPAPPRGLCWPTPALPLVSRCHSASALALWLLGQGSGTCSAHEARTPGALCPGPLFPAHPPVAPSAPATGPPDTPYFRAIQAWLLLVLQVSTQECPSPGALPA